MNRTYFVSMFALLLFLCAIIPLSNGLFASSIENFIAYSPLVSFVRIMLVSCGCAIVLCSIAYCLLSSVYGMRVLVLMPDRTALFYFFAMLIVLPLSCYELAAVTHCDFWPFQSSASLFLFVYGSFVAVRARRYRYILYFLVLLLVLGWAVPPA